MPSPHVVFLRASLQGVFDARRGRRAGTFWANAGLLSLSLHLGDFRVDLFHFPAQARFFRAHVNHAFQRQEQITDVRMDGGGSFSGS